MDYILGQALEQTGAGADILDVNVGLPGIDERQMMVDTVKALQSVVDVLSSLTQLYLRFLMLH